MGLLEVQAAREVRVVKEVRVDLGGQAVGRSWLRAHVVPCIPRARFRVGPALREVRAVQEADQDSARDLALVLVQGWADVQGWAGLVAVCCLRPKVHRPQVVPREIRDVLVVALPATRRIKKWRSRAITPAWVPPRSPWARCRSPRRSR